MFDKNVLMSTEADKLNKQVIVYASKWKEGSTPFCFNGEYIYVQKNLKKVVRIDLSEEVIVIWYFKKNMSDLCTV